VQLDPFQSVAGNHVTFSKLISPNDLSSRHYFHSVATVAPGGSAREVGADIVASYSIRNTGGDQNAILVVAGDHIARGGSRPTCGASVRSYVDSALSVALVRAVHPQPNDIAKHHIVRRGTSAQGNARAIVAGNEIARGIRGSADDVSAG